MNNIKTKLCGQADKGGSENGKEEMTGQTTEICWKLAMQLVRTRLGRLSLKNGCEKEGQVEKTKPRAFTHTQKPCAIPPPERPTTSLTKLHIEDLSQRTRLLHWQHPSSVTQRAGVFVSSQRWRLRPDCSYDAKVARVNSETNCRVKGSFIVFVQLEGYVAAVASQIFPWVTSTVYGYGQKMALPEEQLRTRGKRMTSWREQCEREAPKLLLTGFGYISWAPILIYWSVICYRRACS